MSTPQNWLPSWWYPRGRTVHQQWHRHSGVNSYQKYQDYNAFTFTCSKFCPEGTLCASAFSLEASFIDPTFSFTSYKENKTQRKICNYRLKLYDIFDNWLGTFRYKISFEFSILEILHVWLSIQQNVALYLDFIMSQCHYVFYIAYWRLCLLLYYV